jgi:hypothetical protein
MTFFIILILSSIKLKEEELLKVDEKVAYLEQLGVFFLLTQLILMGYLAERN